MSIKIERSALLEYPAKHIYDLVNDIEAYPEFLKDCKDAKIIEQADSFMVAKLILKKAGLELAFTTKNSLEIGEKISLSLVDGPFKNFSGYWKFTNLGDHASKVSFTLDFEIKNGLASRLIGKLLESTVNELIDSFANRAKNLQIQKEGPTK